MMRTIGLFLGLAALWLLLSGYFDKLLILGFGFLSCLFTVYIARRMDLIDHETVPYHFAPWVLGYWAWLIKEIAVANFAVARIAFSNMNDIRPHVFKLKASKLSEVGLVTLANSITLTPGTVTVDLIEDEMTIHALTSASSDPAIIHEMERRIEALGGGR